ncbi:hypothetical protein BGZ47_003380, partial [Haplosporangium gracile]
MTSKRAHFSTSVKTISDGQSSQRTASLQRQSSFNGTNDPAAAPIRSPSSASP